MRVCSLIDFRCRARLALPLALAVGIALLTQIQRSLADEASDSAASDSVEKDYAEELPRMAPLEPDQALESFQTRPGFHVELVASEPNVTSPVAAAYDEDGRLYVVEMRGYSENRDDQISQVRLLDDADGDGHYERASVFVAGLRWPTAAVCYRGGVFVADAPDIFYYRDTDGDGSADVAKKVFTGFSTSNVQGLLNSLQWGLDNRIYGAASSTGGEIEIVATPAELWGPQAVEAGPRPAKPISLRGRDFSFDPRTLDFRAESGGAQHGMTVDDWGTRYVCSNSDHIQQIMYREADIARNPLLPAPGARLSIAADGPQAEVFRTSPVEPWRVVRTRLRVAGVVPGPVEGGGRAAGYFTSATGVTIYRGDAYPADYRGNAFVGDVGSNVIHRKMIDTTALAHVARRADEGVEFVTSTDVWFRPCQFVNAPDGTLHVLDVYREVIEHPASLPPVIKKHLDLTSGRDRGRIYRLAPDGYTPRRAPRLSQATIAELVATLEHGNGWHVDTAARLLAERFDPAAPPLLKNLLASSAPLARLRALSALATQNALTEAELLTALADGQPGVRRHAVRWAAQLAKPSPELVAALGRLTADPDVHVRYELAFALGAFDGEARLEQLATLARSDADDRWLRVAIQSSLAVGADTVLVALLSDQPGDADRQRRPLLTALAEQEALRGDAQAGPRLAKSLLGRAPDDPTAAACLFAYLDALARSGRELAAVVPADDLQAELRARIAAVVVAASQAASDGSLPPLRRAEAIVLLARSDDPATRDQLAALLDSRQPQEVQLAALKTLARQDDPAVAELLLRAWSGLGPRLRSEATEALFSRPAWIMALLAALEAGGVQRGDFDPARLRSLATHADEPVRTRSQAVLGNVQLARRQDVVDTYQPSLTMAGDIERGRTAFRKVCAACHRAEGVGHELGPNLATIKNRGPEAIVLNVLDPNREANPQFVNYMLITTDGRTLTGMLTAETATSVTLTRAEGASDTLLRGDIDELTSTGLSLMPEGLEQQLDQQAMADLIAYLMSLQ